MLEEFDQILNRLSAIRVKDGFKYGLTWGASQAFNHLIFAVLYLVSAIFYVNWPEEEIMEVKNMFTALFCIIFGIFAAAQAI